MSLHDKLVQKAISMGKGAEELSAAAQKHANATWAYVIAGGIVWYFFGWKWALIPFGLGIYTTVQSVSATKIATKIKNLEQSSATLGDNSTNSQLISSLIVQAYGKVMETSPPAPGSIADATKLPYTKKQIKDALIVALRNTDDPLMKEQLKVGYIMLADWQEGVGESNIGLDLSNIDLKQGTNSQVEQLLEEYKGSENWGEWIEVVKKEGEVLKQELRDLNLW